MPLPRGEFKLITYLDDHRREDAACQHRIGRRTAQGRGELTRPVARVISPRAEQAICREHGG